MNSKCLVLTALLLSSGPVLAQQQLPPVEVRPMPEYPQLYPVYPDHESALSFTCGDLRRPHPTDVENLLQIKDSSQTHRLSLKLMAAVGQACDAGVPLIVVQRGKDGQSLTWRAAYPYEMGVALY